MEGNSNFPWKVHAQLMMLTSLCWISLRTVKKTFCFARGNSSTHGAFAPLWMRNVLIGMTLHSSTNPGSFNGCVHAVIWNGDLAVVKSVQFVLSQMANGQRRILFSWENSLWDNQQENFGMRENHWWRIVQERIESCSHECSKENIQGTVFCGSIWWRISKQGRTVKEELFKPKFKQTWENFKMFSLLREDKFKPFWNRQTAHCRQRSCVGHWEGWVPIVRNCSQEDCAQQSLPCMFPVPTIKNFEGLSQSKKRDAFAGQVNKKWSIREMICFASHVEVHRSDHQWQWMRKMPLFSCASYMGVFMWCVFLNNSDRDHRKNSDWVGPQQGFSSHVIHCGHQCALDFTVLELCWNQTKEPNKSSFDCFIVLHPVVGHVECHHAINHDSTWWLNGTAAITNQSPLVSASVLGFHEHFLSHARRRKLANQNEVRMEDPKKHEPKQKWRSCEISRVDRRGFVKNKSYNSFSLPQKQHHKIEFRALER